jgi:16S rRNA (cytidine1402-2'-O)-methyltransferase
MARPEHEAEAEAESRRGYFIRSQFFPARTLAPGLYIVGTPIGNLGDITIRALDTLAGADLVACEDTRVTRKLLTRYGIKGKVTAYHEHSGDQAHRRLLESVTAGGSVAMVSDAGTPLISDPGFQLVVDAAAAGLAVVPIPGPSSAITALSAAGLPTDAVLFLGFLPPKTIARRKRLAEFAALPATLLFFESPNRTGALLADAAAEFGGERQAAVCRELTKLHETFDRGPLAELAARYAEADVKGEVVLVVGPPGAPPAPATEDVDALLGAALRSMSMKEAAQNVAEMTGLSRRDLYQRALSLKGSGG